jgi:tRNA-uridine 2-sulfurtransferase
VSAPSVRAVGLLSGGLDSALAARLLLDHNIDVVGLHLESPTACRSDVREVAKDLGIPLVVRPKGEEYLRLLRHPRFGYGRNMNPCIDCRVFMLQLGRPYLEEFGAQFLFTGEVVGQRPMSQTMPSILRIDRHSGLEGLVLRPLSAQLLPETEPERRGWVDRSRMLAIQGRGRTEQMALAARFGLRHYQSPGGGCLLTDARFSAKLHDLFVHQPEAQTTMDDVALLRLGRHVRVADHAKVVLGRDREENGRLSAFANADRWLVTPDGFPGPTALVCGPRTPELAAAAASLIARYARAPEPSWTVRWDDRGTTRRIELETVLRPASGAGTPLDGREMGAPATRPAALEARN